MIPRYKHGMACVRCVAQLAEGRVSLDIHRIHRSWRRRFLEFWSLVDIGDPDECWDWHGGRSKGIPRHSMNRGWVAAAVARGPRNYYAPSRVAAWFSWGDFGQLNIERICGDPNCCNPLHVRVKGVPHFYFNRRLETIDFSFDARKLRNDTQDFLELTRIRQPMRFKRLQRINNDWIRYRLSDSDLPLVPPSDEGEGFNEPQELDAEELGEESEALTEEEC